MKKALFTVYSCAFCYLLPFPNSPRQCLQLLSFGTLLMVRDPHAFGWWKNKSAGNLIKGWIQMNLGPPHGPRQVGVFWKTDTECPGCSHFPVVFSSASIQPTFDQTKNETPISHWHQDHLKFPKYSTSHLIFQHPAVPFTHVPSQHPRFVLYSHLLGIFPCLFLSRGASSMGATPIAAPDAL